MSQKTKSSSIVYDWHRQDARITECEDVACTVNSNYGTGGNNVPMTITERFVVRRLTFNPKGM